MNTINIIGAGPAGLTAAIILLRQGYQVTVYEKSPDVGYRLSGDFQGLENWSSDTDITRMLNSIGIDINFLCEPYYSTVVHARGVEPIPDLVPKTRLGQAVLDNPIKHTA